MTTLADNTPISFDLAPDPAELTEMRGGRRELITDEEIGKSRIVVTQLAAEALQESTVGPAGIVTFDVTFHPDRGNRFIYAKLVLSVLEPTGAAFIDCQPRETITEAVEVAVDSKGSVSLGVPKIVGGGAEVGRKISFTGRHRVVRNSGAGTTIAVWEFEEAPVLNEGILHQVDLVVTLPAGAPIRCALSVTADLARPGLDGALKWFRRMIFGDRRHELIIEIPVAPPPPERSRFWFGLDKLMM